MASEGLSPLFTPLYNLLKKKKQRGKSLLWSPGQIWPGELLHFSPFSSPAAAASPCTSELTELCWIWIQKPSAEIFFLKFLLLVLGTKAMAAWSSTEWVIRAGSDALLVGPSRRRGGDARYSGSHKAQGADSPAGYQPCCTAALPSRCQATPSILFFQNTLIFLPLLTPSGGLIGELRCRGCCWVLLAVPPSCRPLGWQLAGRRPVCAQAGAEGIWNGGGVLGLRWSVGVWVGPGRYRLASAIPRLVWGMGCSGVCYRWPREWDRKWSTAISLSAAACLAFLCISARQVGFVDVCYVLVRLQEIRLKKKIIYFHILCSWLGRGALTRALGTNPELWGSWKDWLDIGSGS